MAKQKIGDLVKFEYLDGTIVSGKIIQEKDKDGYIIVKGSKYKYPVKEEFLRKNSIL